MLDALARALSPRRTRCYSFVRDPRKERFIRLAGCDVASSEGERVCTRGEQLTSIDFYGN